MDEELREGLEAYATDLFAGEDEVLRWVREESERRGFPAIAISPLEGRFLAVLAAATGARRLLELGTLGGYSALWQLSLLPPEARMTTVELEKARADLAREAFRRAGVADRVEVRVGHAGEVLDAVLEDRDREGGDRFDFAFLDADKENYPVYLQKLSRLLEPGAILAADNVFWDGRVLESPPEDSSTRGIQEFNRRLAGSSLFDTAVVPVRDGLAVARFRG